MRIVYCIPATSNSGGMERVLARKVNYLTEQGHELIVQPISVVPLRSSLLMRLCSSMTWESTTMRPTERDS